MPEQELYDFSIPLTQNYCAGGLVNHNTQTAAAEVACHAIGWYPDWWQGRRFDKAVEIWTGCETAELSRDVIQHALLGTKDDPALIGTGFLPAELLGRITYRQAGISNAVDTIKVRHRTGDYSSLTLKTYRAGAGGEVGRKAWQGTSRHVIWFDEEPPEDIYNEGLTRILDVKGILMVTFTPLLGQSRVVNHFLSDDPE